jgi:ribonuclease J
VAKNTPEIKIIDATLPSASSKNAEQKPQGRRTGFGRKKASAQKPASKPTKQLAAESQPQKAMENPKKQTASRGRTPKKEPAAQAAAATMIQQPKKQTQQNRRKSKSKKPSVRIIPLGGLNEIGKNMTAYECGNDIFIIDCGNAFPDADMLGVDLVIPDFTYLEKNAQKVRGVVITHGHEDHIGAIPYLLKKLNVPIYGGRLALGLIEGKLKEHGLLGRAKLISVAPHDIIQLGCMSVEMIRVNHSIPDAMACAVRTPAGIIIQTGDFKIDFTPVQSEMIDLARFAELGSEGVLCMLSDSTNAERPGFTPSERTVGHTFQQLFQQAGDRRIIIASFASNIHRIQQIIDNAHKTGRKVAVSGRSMVNVVAKAIELGYLSVPKDVMIDIDNIGRYPKNKLVLVTTGSQGEPMAALSRMAAGEHRKVSVTSDDFIIISATPIPGNEKHVTRVVNDLLKLGAEVIYKSMYDVHVSGHACQGEQTMLLSIVKPKYFIPVHGEYKHLKAHMEIARSLGIPENHTMIADIGQVIELNEDAMQVVDTVEAGRVFVDGYGVGDVGAIVLRDRQHLAQDGLIIVVVTIENESGAVVAGPDIVSRGFVYVRESEQLMEEARNLVKQTLSDCQEKNIKEWSAMKIRIKDQLSSFIYKKTKRDPMILPIIMEI